MGSAAGLPAMPVVVLSAERAAGLVTGLAAGVAAGSAAVFASGRGCCFGICLGARHRFLVVNLAVRFTVDNTADLAVGIAVARPAANGNPASFRGRPRSAAEYRGYCRGHCNENKVNQSMCIRGKPVWNFTGLPAANREPLSLELGREGTRRGLPGEPLQIEELVGW